MITQATLTAARRLVSIYNNGDSDFMSFKLKLSTGHKAQLCYSWRLASLQEGRDVQLGEGQLPQLPEDV